MDPRLTNLLLPAVVGLLAIGVIVQVLLWRRKDRAMRDEMSRTLSDMREMREDLQSRFGQLLKSMVPASTVTRSIDERLDRVREALEERLGAMQEESAAQLAHAGESTVAVANGQREDNAAALLKVKESLVATLDKLTLYMNQMVAQSLAENATTQRSQISTIVDHLTQLVEATEQKLQTHRIESDARLQRVAAEVAVVSKFLAASRAFGATLAEDLETAETNHFPNR